MFKPKKMLLMAMIMFLMSSIVSAQKKETYSGKMVLPSDIVAIELRSSGDYEPGETQGTAKYEYYTDSEGKRIKNGKFEFSFNTYSGGIFHETITGEYLDNKKTGKWSFVNGGGITAGANGYLVQTSKENTKLAEFTYSDDRRNGKFLAILDPTDSFTGLVFYLDGNLTNDYPTGKMEVKIFGLLGQDGTLNASFDDNGLPEGEWKYVKVSGGSFNTYSFREGLLAKVRKFDNSTGEWKTLFERDFEDKVDAALKNCSAIKVGQETYYLSNIDGKHYQLKYTYYRYSLGLEEYESDVLMYLLSTFDKLNFDLKDKTHVKKELVEADDKFYKHTYLVKMLSKQCDSIIQDYNKAEKRLHAITAQCNEEKWLENARQKELSNEKNGDLYLAIHRMLIQNFHPFECPEVDKFWPRDSEFLKRDENGIQLKHEKVTEALNNLNESNNPGYYKKQWDVIYGLSGYAKRFNNVSEQQETNFTIVRQAQINLKNCKDNLSRKQRKALRKLVDDNDIQGIINFLENPDSYEK